MAGRLVVAISHYSSLFTAITQCLPTLEALSLPHTINKPKLSSVAGLQDPAGFAAEPAKNTKSCPAFGQLIPDVWIAPCSRAELDKLGEAREGGHAAP